MKCKIYESATINEHCSYNGTILGNTNILKAEETCNNTTNMHINPMNMTKNNRICPIETSTRYKCDQCSKTFKRKANLSSHMKVHTDFAYICEYCGKKFARSGNLVQHIRIHTNEKPFKCQYCSKK